MRSSGLNFLALASLRVLVRKTKKAGEAKAGHDSAPERAISAVVVEATEQLVQGPTRFPKASMH